MNEYRCHTSVFESYFYVLSSSQKDMPFDKRDILRKIVHTKLFFLYILQVLISKIQIFPFLNIFFKTHSDI